MKTIINSSPKTSIDNSERKEYKGSKLTHYLERFEKDSTKHIITQKEIRHVIGLLEGAKRKLKKVLDNIA